NNISGANNFIQLWPGALTHAICVFLGLIAMGLHNSRQRSRILGLLARAGMGVVGGTVCFLVIAQVVAHLRLDRTVLLASGVMMIGACVALRLLFEWLVDENLFKRRVLVYGAGRMAGSIATLRRRSDRRGFTAVAYLPADGDDSASVDAAQKIALDTDMLKFCEAHHVDEIVVAMDDRRRRFPMDQLLECRLDGIEIIDVVSFLERETGKVRLDVLNPSWMIFSDGFRRGNLNAALERVCDVLASLALLILALPFMVLAVLAIKLEDGWRATIFYRQDRVGQYGKTFRLLKFRSMREDAERDGKAQWAQKNDARVTRVGSVIRKTRIDELPQILNVLRGEMSFVGPRPERPEFVSRLNERVPFYRERHTIKPGITGWAQLCYPYGSSEQDSLEKLQYDLFYVKNHSLLFYLAVLVQTVEVIVMRRGAR
ncbi:MAG: TIGR03013 family PEP-CTERM/XrtA system glycosyltransferase, partial [Candidatus Obscuribacterales bacterium]|nr:TIGR03013 family PEP-CTERM/XrtA system glycosyltransferase [Steroidobacteraceae bacterium]